MCACIDRDISETRSHGCRVPTGRAKPVASMPANPAVGRSARYRATAEGMGFEPREATPLTCAYSTELLVRELSMSFGTSVCQMVIPPEHWRAQVEGAPAARHGCCGYFVYCGYCT
jgi:hypothetical protein